MKQNYKRSFDELSRIFESIDRFFEQNNIERKVQFDIELTAEELFTNMVRHNPDGRSDIVLELGLTKNSIVMKLTDHEEVPFDITGTKEVDFDQYIKQGKSGGLGIQLVKEKMDKIDFNHHQGRSTVTLTKHIPKSQNA